MDDKKRRRLLLRIDHRILNCEDRLRGFRQGLEDAKRGSSVDRVGSISVMTTHTKEDVELVQGWIDKWESALADWKEIKETLIGALADPTARGGPRCKQHSTFRRTCDGCLLEYARKTLPEEVR